MKWVVIGLVVVGVVVLGCVGLVLVGLVASDGDGAQKVGEVDQPAQVDVPAEPQQTFGVGDVIEAGDWRFVVHSAHYPTGEEWRPEAGHKFLMLDMEVTNVTDDTETLSGIMAFGLKDSQNREYDNRISSAAPGNEPTGDFIGGETKRGWVVFMVAEDAGDCTFVFEPSAFGRERVFVALQ